MKRIDTAKIDFLGLDRVLKRGTGEIICEDGQALLIRDTVSGACLLACEDPERGLSVLDRYLPPECDLLMVSDHRLGLIAFEKYGFSGRLECYQAAYYGDPPAADDDLTVRTAGPQDLPLLLSCYHNISPDELGQVVERQSILLGYKDDQLIGFIGEHLEGSMGLLYVFPEYRRRGYGAALEKRCIAKTLAEGYTPFGQVEKDNHESLLLQKKLGLTVSPNLIVWMWK